MLLLHSRGLERDGSEIKCIIHKEVDGIISLSVDRESVVERHVMHCRAGYREFITQRSFKYYRVYREQRSS